jgi:hypothetical protein
MIVIALLMDAPPQSLYFTDSNNFQKVNRKKTQEGVNFVSKVYSPWIGSKVKELL